MVVERAEFESRNRKRIKRTTVGLYMFKFVLPVPVNYGRPTREADRFWWEEVPGVTTYGLAERWAKARAKSLNAKRVILDADNH